MGRIVSDLLAEGLAGRKQRPAEYELIWGSGSLGALVDIGDKEALYATLDAPVRRVKRGR